MASKAVNDIRLYSKVISLFLTNSVVARRNRYNSQSAGCDFYYIRSKNNIVTYQFNKKLFAYPKC